MPWDNDGTDFGSNLWGYRGLANQGPSGWRRETRDNNQAAKRLFWAQRDNDNYCLGIEVELRGSLSNAIVHFQTDELAEKSRGETLNLTGRTVTAQIYLPSGIEGPQNARSGVILFFQDEDWTWAQTDWKNIEDTNKWIPLSIKPDDLVQRFPGFDPTKIRTIGIKVGTNSQAHGFSYKGHFYIDNVSASTIPEVQFDFRSPDTRTEKEMKNIADLKIKAFLIIDPIKRQSLLDNAVSIIFEKLSSVSEVVVIDLFNEPEWLILDSDINIPNTRSGGSWGGWSEVPGGGLTASGPAAVVEGSTLHLFVRGTDNQIYTNTRSGGTWSGWTQVPGGGLTASGLAAVAEGSTLHLFVRGTNDRIYINTRSGGSFGGWTEVPGGGRTPSQPAAVVDSSGNLRLYVRGLGNRIYVNVRSGGVWSGWSEVPGGGLTSSGPAAVLDGSQVGLFVQGADNRIYTITP